MVKETEKPIAKQKWCIAHSHRGVPLIQGETIDDGGYICRVDARVDAETRHKRALLIAASPELLAACRHALSTLKLCRDDLEMAGSGGADESDEMCEEAKALTPAIEELEAAVAKAEGR